MKKLFLTSIFFLSLVIAQGQGVLKAQEVDCSDASISGSAFCKSKSDSSENPLLAPDSIAGRITQIVIVLAGTVSIFVMILAGISFITAGGKPDKVATARNSIIYASIGLVVSISAQVIVSFVIGRA